jgi:hypothetical protein
MKFFPSKAVGFNTATNPVTKNCLKIWFLDCWKSRQLSRYFNPEII